MHRHGHWVIRWVDTMEVLADPNVIDACLHAIRGDESEIPRRATTAMGITEHQDELTRLHDTAADGPEAMCILPVALLIHERDRSVHMF